MPRTSQRLLTRFAVIFSMVIGVHFGVQALLGPVDRHQRQLPKTADEAIAWEGKHIVVEEGRTPTGGAYRVEVSRSHDGDLCAFLYVFEHGREPIVGGGGGGCSTAPLSYSYGEGIAGTTAPQISRIDIVGEKSTVTIATHPLPASVGKGNYFFEVRSVSLVEIEGRDTRGHLIKRVTADGKS